MARVDIDSGITYTYGKISANHGLDGIQFINGNARLVPTHGATNHCVGIALAALAVI